MTKERQQRRQRRTECQCVSRYRSKSKPTANGLEEGRVGVCTEGVRHRREPSDLRHHTHRYVVENTPPCKVEEGMNEAEQEAALDIVPNGPRYC